MEAVWPDTHVEEGNLAVHVSKLRGKLGRREDGEPTSRPRRATAIASRPLSARLEDFDLVIRKRTRSHIITHEIEETDVAGSLAIGEGQGSAVPALVPPDSGHALTLPATTRTASAQKTLHAAQLTRDGRGFSSLLQWRGAFRPIASTAPQKPAVTVASVHSIAVFAATRAECAGRRCVSRSGHRGQSGVAARQSAPDYRQADKRSSEV